MYTLFIVIFVIIAIAMILIVLIQESKGGGLASSFAASNQIMGVRKTTDFLEKATWGLAIAMVVLSVLSVAFIPKTTTKEAPLNIVAPALPAAESQQQAAPAPAAPATPAAPAETPAE